MGRPKKEVGLTDKNSKICDICGERKVLLEFKNYNGRYTKQCTECIGKAKTITTKKNIDEAKKFYVYRFLDKDDKVIYIGQSIRLETRIKSHIESSRNINSNIPYYEVAKIQYCEFYDGYHMELYEKHLICKYYPVGNTQSKHKMPENPIFEIPEPKWYNFIFEKECMDIINRNLRIRGTPRSNEWVMEYINYMKNDLSCYFTQFEGFDYTGELYGKIMEREFNSEFEFFYDINIL